jgi:hypothetical protein
MPKFGDTPQHAVDKCHTCAHLVEIKGQTQKEHVRQCGAVDNKVGKLPARVTSCTVYHKKTDPSLAMMMNMAWVLTLDQKKRTVGFTPPRKQPSWVADVEEMTMGDDND